MVLDVVPPYPELVNPPACSGIMSKLNMPAFFGSLRMSGSVPLAYIDMINGSPWMVSSLERIVSPSISNDYS